ncbi:hypothetical protein C8R42DRAFT_727386 [Lentinula raphanica]|nr:hypothetical protein C8R42DRAFT_727386 [Lentinula raphanica]
MAQPDETEINVPELAVVADDGEAPNECWLDEEAAEECREEDWEEEWFEDEDLQERLHKHALAMDKDGLDED